MIGTPFLLGTVRFEIGSSTNIVPLLLGCWGLQGWKLSTAPLVLGNSRGKGVKIKNCPGLARKKLAKKLNQKSKQKLKQKLN